MDLGNFFSEGVMGWPKGKPRAPETLAKMAASRALTCMARRRKPVVIDGVEHWKCSSCHQVLPADRFYQTRRNTSCLTSQCRSCHIATSVATRDPIRTRIARRESAREQRRANPDKARENDRRPRARDPEKARARALLNAAVRRGDIHRPASCPVCGTAGRVEGHHHDYAKPLEVTWLCPLCHAAKHHPMQKEVGRV
jgi:rubredoxin